MGYVTAGTCPEAWIYIPFKIKRCHETHFIRKSRHAINKKLQKLKKRNENECFRPGSNRRPSACEADVITTTLRKRRLKSDWTSTNLLANSVRCIYFPFVFYLAPSVDLKSNSFWWESQIKYPVTIRIKTRWVIFKSNENLKSAVSLWSYDLLL